MKYLKLYENLQTREEVKTFMQQYYSCYIEKDGNIEPDNFVINSNGKIDVDGNITLSGLYFNEYQSSLFLDKYNWPFQKLPLQFNKINGNFICLGPLGSKNKSKIGLTTLEGAPEWVAGHFIIQYQNLTNLVGGPKFVGGIYNCEDNPLTSLEGIAEDIASIAVLNEDIKPEDALTFDDDNLKTLNHFARKILNKPSSQFILDKLKLLSSTTPLRTKMKSPFKPNNWKSKRLETHVVPSRLLCNFIKLTLTLPPDSLHEVKSGLYTTKILSILRQDCPSLYQKVKDLESKKNQWGTDLQADAGEYGL